MGERARACVFGGGGVVQSRRVSLNAGAIPRAFITLVLTSLLEISSRLWKFANAKFSLLQYSNTAG